jgi:hypothetical protein
MRANLLLLKVSRQSRLHAKGSLTFGQAHNGRSGGGGSKSYSKWLIIFRGRDRQKWFRRRPPRPSPRQAFLSRTRALQNLGLISANHKMKQEGTGGKYRAHCGLLDTVSVCRAQQKIVVPTQFSRATIHCPPSLATDTSKKVVAKFNYCSRKSGVIQHASLMRVARGQRYSALVLEKSVMSAT